MENDIKYYWKVQRCSLFYFHYAFVDTKEHLADQLFVKHKVRVYFDGEYAKEGTVYRIIVCRIRKAHAKRFLRALSELPDKMLLLGNKDYVNFCEHMMENFQA